MIDDSEYTLSYLGRHPVQQTRNTTRGGATPPTAKRTRSFMKLFVRQDTSVVSHKYGYEDARGFWLSARDQGRPVVAY